MIATPPPPALERLEIRAVRRDQRLPVQRYAGWLFAGALGVFAGVVTLSDMLTWPWFGLVMIGVAAIITPPAFLVLRRRRLLVDARTVTSVPALGRRRVFDRESIRALRVATSTLSTRGVIGDMGGPVLLLLDGGGRCLRMIRSDRFTEADCNRLAAHLRVPITGTYADCRSFADLDAEHPGAATRGQLRAGRWIRLTEWLFAVGFVLALAALVLGIVRRDVATPATAYSITATNAAPIITLPGAGTYRGSYTTSGCAQAGASFQTVGVPTVVNRGQWSLGMSPSRPLGSSGDVSVNVIGSPGPVAFSIAPAGACQTWSLTLTWTSTTP